MNPLQYFEDNIVGHYNAPRRTHIVLSAEYNIYKFKFRQTGRFQMLNDYRYKPDSFFRSYVVSKESLLGFLFSAVSFFINTVRFG